MDELALLAIDVAIKSLADGELDEVGETERTMSLLQALMDSVKRNVDIKCLDTAISTLWDAQDKEIYKDERRSIILFHLIKAHLTLYGICDWIQDLDACERHFNKGVEAAGSFDEFMGHVTNASLQPTETQAAAQLTEACRNSLHTDTLDTVICIATKALSNVTRWSIQVANLHLILSKALVLKYLNGGGVENLKQAATKTRQAEIIAQGDAPLAYLCLTKLWYTEWLRLIDCKETTAITRYCSYLTRLIEIDKEWENLSSMGTKVGEEGIEDVVLEEGIRFLTASLHHYTTHHPRRLDSLLHLGRGLYKRYERRFEHQDLEDCIVFRREALNLQPFPHPLRSSSLGDLATSIFIRFEQKGAFQDLEECIVLHREALSLQVLMQDDYFPSLENIGIALLTRFEQTGASEDLDECIMLHREALSIQPMPSPHRHTSLNNLANALSARFMSKGTSRDLEECISLNREALQLRTAPHPERSMSLNNLASTLSTRYKKTKTLCDLEEAIMLYRQALDLRPVPHTNRSSSLLGLSATLYTRFQKDSTIQDLEESIALQQEALKLFPPSHPSRSTSLKSLANAIISRFERSKNLQDLEACINLHQEALSLLSAPHPDRSPTLSSLAAALTTRYEHNNKLSDVDEHDLDELASPDYIPDNLHSAFDIVDETDLEDALRCYEEASRYETGRLLNRLSASNNWAVCAEKHNRLFSALQAWRHALDLLPLLAPLELTLHERQDALEHSKRIIVNAASCAIKLCQYNDAVLFLSNGRSIFWSQALQLRIPVDSITLTHPALADKLSALSRQLERASYSGLGPGAKAFTSSGSGVETYSSLRELADQRRHIIDEVQKIPNYRGFLKPLSFSSLQAAASRGPIILLNASNHGCDALILRESEEVEHIPLPKVIPISLELLSGMLYNSLEAGTRKIDTTKHTSWINACRDMMQVRPVGSENQIDELWVILWYLWDAIVEPVIRALGLEKSDSPERIWWCPTGFFSSMPIHAAGVYSENYTPIDCTFQYAVSSYCTSPQDLLHSAPIITQDFRVTAIIEPEAPGAAVLPATRQELKKVQKHLPDPQNLITHIGSKDSPNKFQDILPDIQQSSFVHFGCHGVQDVKSPLDSYMLLSGEKLTMSRIIQECRVPEGALAYLSACETAKADGVRPDESLNLVATMMFSGFRSVVGTLWSMLDEDGPVVADVFYRHLFRNGKEKLPNVTDAAFALHLATKELRDQGKPFRSWAPFVHYGI